MKRMQQEMSFCAWFCWNRRRQGVRWPTKSISVSASKEIISSPLLVEHEKKNLNQSMTSFCASQILSGRRVAVVTSGSTTVPMDAHAIEYIDSVGSGNRGAGCAEGFLQRGYAVVFLHRSGSLLPFSRHFAKQIKNGGFMDLLHVDGNDTITVKNSSMAKKKALLRIEF